MAAKPTPGVYVTEFNAFPPSVVGVPTAVPAFVGYTEKGPALTPVLLSSLADFETTFGGAFQPTYKIVAAAAPGDFQVGSNAYQLQQIGASWFNLYYSMRLFFNNGGGTCYVVSVGDYSKPVQEADLANGLAAIRFQVGPTMLVVPDAVRLPDIGAYQNVIQAMLSQSGEIQDRIAILDVYGSQTINQKNVDTALTPLIDVFQGSVGSSFLSYGASYFPFLNTSVVQTAEVNYTNFDAAPDPDVKTDPPGGTMLQYLLEQVADTLYGTLHGTTGSEREAVQGWINQITVVVEDPSKPDDPGIQSQIAALNQNLSNALPPYQQWQNVVLQKLNVLPPSGGMAGVYTLSDNTKGVWNAPANISMNSVLSCTVKLNNDQQGPLTAPLNGKSVNVIRDFVGQGSVVWGARTLDGNSNDWRYIQVRREITYIEQSIKNALNPFVFAANDGQTWVTVTSMISNFLQGIWSQGGLMGDKASDAYTVACGLGSTMTGQDILDGYMIVQVTLQMVRPAEFIELTFKQHMQSA